MKNPKWETSDFVLLCVQSQETLRSGETPYSKISERCNVTAARISDVANNKIDCQLSTFIEIATGLRIHPKELFDIIFDFEEYYSELDK